jgi:hypothetical protein
VSRGVVYKFELHPGVTVLDLPAEARPIRAAYQRGGVWLWALVPLPNPGTPGQWAFLTVGTGHADHAWSDFGDYIGTAEFPAADGGLLFHVFRVSAPAPSEARDE